MDRLRAIVVEDERLPRLALLQKLQNFASHVEVVDECDSYESARASILRHRPDLLFLDIQLQGRNSIDLIRELSQQMAMPHIIFTTAYDDRQYLMSAIKLHAVDYLLKPVGKEELAEAIAKVRPDAEPRQDAGSPREDKLSFRTSDGVLLISPDNIAYIKAARNYSILVGLHCEELLLSSLATLEQELDAKTYIRIDRSTIVNADNILQINTRRSVCFFRMADSSEIELEVSKVGIDNLMSIKGKKGI